MPLPAFAERAGEQRDISCIRGENRGTSTPGGDPFGDAPAEMRLLRYNTVGPVAIGGPQRSSCNASVGRGSRAVGRALSMQRAHHAARGHNWLTMHFRKAEVIFIEVTD